MVFQLQDTPTAWAAAELEAARSRWLFTLHSRTDFNDHADPAQKRLLFRLWLVPPDGDQLPESWKVLYKAIGKGTVRGGIIGQQHDAARKNYEQLQAAALGMCLSD